MHLYVCVYVCISIYIYMYICTSSCICKKPGFVHMYIYIHNMYKKEYFLFLIGFKYPQKCKMLPNYNKDYTRDLGTTRFLYVLYDGTCMISAGFP